LRATEFQNAVQGSIIVEQYSARTIELARFADNLIPNKESKRKHFENSLNPHVKERVLRHEVKDYARLVEVASLVERGIHESAVAYNLERRTKQQTSHPAKRPTIGSGSKSFVGRNLPLAVGNQGPPYNECGKAHSGKCRMETQIVLNIEGLTISKGIFLRILLLKIQQPQGNEAQARVHSLIPGDGDDKDKSEKVNTDVVAGALS
jgi:hypothetical protein